MLGHNNSQRTCATAIHSAYTDLNVALFNNISGILSHQDVELVHAFIEPALSNCNIYLHTLVLQHSYMHPMGQSESISVVCILMALSVQITDESVGLAALQNGKKPT
jgi:hypothetical protein